MATSCTWKCSTAAAPARQPHTGGEGTAKAAVAKAPAAEGHGSGGEGSGNESGGEGSGGEEGSRVYFNLALDETFDMQFAAAPD